MAQDTFADLVKEDGNDNEDILKVKPNEKIFELIIASLNQIKNVVLAYQYVCVGTNDRHKRFLSRLVQKERKKMRGVKIHPKCLVMFWM